MRSKKEAKERLKYYKQIHASHLYKDMVAKGGRERWKQYLTDRLAVESCADLELEHLKAFASAIYKTNEPREDDKVISMLPMLNAKQLRESGREDMTNKQSWRIKRRWQYLTQYLRSDVRPRKAFEDYIIKICGQNAKFEKLTKKQASKLIVAIDAWIKSIEGGR